MSKLFACLFDLQMRLAARQLNPRRQSVASGASGRILEVGIGTAQNAPFYPPGARVIGVDPEPAMLARARRRAHDAPAAIDLAAAAGEALPFRDGTFDSAVITLVLCSVDSQENALREVHRVLKPGGHLHFLEHVRSEAPGWARVQDALTPVCKRVAGG